MGASDEKTGGEWRPLAEEQNGRAKGTPLNGAAPVATGAYDLLTSLPLLLGGALDDLRSIAGGMRYLPELARLLAEIDNGVRSLDAEVRRMREAVESMGGDVGELHPRLDDLQRSIPLNRLRRRGPDKS